MTNHQKSLVSVFFPTRGVTYSYLNDAFDLKVGDLVFVEGCLSGVRGEVKEVSHSFRIKPSVYKRVIAVADTAVCGEFFSLNENFLTYDLDALNFEKVLSWFKPPENEEFLEVRNGSFFSLCEMKKLGASAKVIELGVDYYKNERVLFLEVSSSKVRAIVAGEDYYTVEFDWRGGEVSSPVCSCFCTGPCKHEVAVLLKLKEILKSVKKTPFCAISKGVLARFVKSNGFVIK